MGAALGSVWLCAELGVVLGSACFTEKAGWAGDIGAAGADEFVFWCDRVMLVCGGGVSWCGGGAIWCGGGVIGHRFQLNGDHGTVFLNSVPAELAWTPVSPSWRRFCFGFALFRLVPLCFVLFRPALDPYCGCSGPTPRPLCANLEVPTSNRRFLGPIRGWDFEVDVLKRSRGGLGPCWSLAGALLGPCRGPSWGPY